MDVSMDSKVLFKIMGKNFILQICIDGKHKQKTCSVNCNKKWF